MVLKGDVVLIAPSLLPRYTEQISVDNSLPFVDALVDFFSSYRELREACSDSEYDRILEKLKSEWYFVGASVSDVIRVASALIYPSWFVASRSFWVRALCQIAFLFVDDGSTFVALTRLSLVFRPARSSPSTVSPKAQ